MQGIEIIVSYFPDLSSKQQQQFAALDGLYKEWNDKINVISRKDLENLYINHVLHSLGIAKVISFLPAAHILDVGTGGGFPGIPLSIFFPETQFHLVDSIGKKINVVNEVVNSLGLKNVVAEKIRVEEIRNRKYDFVVSRAVTQMKTFYGWVSGKISKQSNHDLDNGILYLKGGNLDEEMGELKRPYSLYSLSDYFKEEFFETKSVVYVPIV